MKKNLIIICWVLIMPELLAVSCSRTDINSINQSESVLITELESYNGQILGESPQTRSWRDKIGPISSIAIADLKGAAEGAGIGAEIGLIAGPSSAIVLGTFVGILGGVVSSLSKYYTVEGDLKQDSTMIDASSLLLQTEVALSNIDAVKAIVNQSVDGEEKLLLDQDFIDVGVMHNYILGEILDVFEDVSYQKNSESNFSELELSIIHSDEFLTAINSLLTSYMTNGVTAKSGYLTDKVLGLYQQVFECCADSYDDVVTCINAYLSIIEDSGELTAEEKNSIYCGLAVSLYSLNFWNNYGLFAKE